MSRRALFTILFIALVSGGIHLLAAAPTQKMPPFSITSQKMEADTKRLTMNYSGNVKLTSPLYSTVMICDMLMANAKSKKEITEITATGNVDVTRVLVGKGKGDPDKKIHATSQKTTYDGQTLRLMTVKGIRPVFVMTNLKTKEHLMDITGDKIVYNLKDQKINVENPSVTGGVNK